MPTPPKKSILFDAIIDIKWIPPLNIGKMRVILQTKFKKLPELFHGQTLAGAGIEPTARAAYNIYDTPRLRHLH